MEYIWARPVSYDDGFGDEDNDNDGILPGLAAACVEKLCGILPPNVVLGKCSSQGAFLLQQVVKYYY
jgi:hypothetical protein